MDQQLREWRRLGIGGSDAPVIMGVSPWRTPYQLWEEKALGIDSDFDSSSMKRGRDLEEAARQEFEKRMNTLVAPERVIHPAKSWLRASLDGIDLNKKIMVEIKCPGKEDHAKALSKKVPEKYIPQCQHQMAVTDLDGMYYFSFDGKEGVIVEVPRDQKYIDEMLVKESEFWDKVQKKIAPELTERDFVSFAGNKEWEDLSNRLKIIRGQKKDLEKEDGEILEKMLSLSQGRNAQGLSISLRKSICEGHIDWKKIREEYPHIPFDSYRKSSFIKWTVRDI